MVVDMKNKWLMIFLFCFFVSFFILLFIFRLNINEMNKGESIVDIFENITEEPVLTELQTIDTLYYERIGFLSNWEMNILGKLSARTRSLILENPSKIGLPPPVFPGDNSFSTAGYSFHSSKFSPEILNLFCLERKHKSSIISKVNDQVIFFQFTKNSYVIKLYVFEKSGYFILNIVKYTGHR